MARTRLRAEASSGERKRLKPAAGDGPESSHIDFLCVSGFRITASRCPE